MHAVADVALPFAIVLLLGTALARGVRDARRFLEPLAVACVFAAAVDAAAVLAGGDASLASFVLPVAVGAIAILLALVEEREQSAPGPVEPPPPSAEPESEAVRAPSPLWSRGDYGPGHRPAQRSP
jgi:hypothetical protein